MLDNSAASQKKLESGMHEIERGNDDASEWKDC